MPPTPPTAATDPSEPSLKPGDTLRDGRFAIAGRLGEGGQATTFDAVDKAQGRRVTVKRFRVRGASSWKEVELAEREAKVLAHIHHPNLPVYVDHFEEGGALYLVTEHIEGQTVSALRTEGAIGQDDVVRFLTDAAAALDYLHGRSPPLVHRDIKPSNVIRRPDGSYAIIDFGAVRDRLKVTGSTVVGTFGFMAPEQFQGRAMAASDVYAVGATAVAMLSGREPEELPHKGLAIDVEAALAGTVDPALIRTLAKMVEPDPDRRAQSLIPLVRDLRLSPRGRGASPNDGRTRGETRGASDAGARDEARGPFDGSRDPARGPFDGRGGDGRDEPRGPAAAGDGAGGPSGADPKRRDAGAPQSFWEEPLRWNEGERVRTEASRQVERAVDEAEEQVKRVVEEVGDQVRRVVAEVSAGRTGGARREVRKVAQVAKREAKRAIEEARRAAKDAERASKEERRAAREAGRRARTEAASDRWRTSQEEARRLEIEARLKEADARRLAAEARRARGTPLGGPVLLVVLLALTIAQLAVLLGLKVIAPVVLYLVSALFFSSVPGRAMRAAARHVAAAGTRAVTAIGRAKDVVRGRVPPEQASEPSVRVLGEGPVNAHGATEVGTVGAVDPYAQTHVSSVGRTEGPPKGRFASEDAAGGGRFEDDGAAEEEAAAEDEAAARSRGRR